MKKRHEGFVLISVLVILAFMTALVMELSYGLFAATSNLKNWTVSQRLSFVAYSGIRLASLAIKEHSKVYRYTFPERVDMPLANIVEGFNGKVFIRIEDEGGKINLNALVMRNKRLNSDVYNSLRRLLSVLNLDQGMADRFVDWIDEDGEPRVKGSEDLAKNGPFDSVDEILLVNGVDLDTFNKLRPHVTVYGATERMNININTASIPVIMSLSDSITEETAKSIVSQRTIKPFEGLEDPELTRILGNVKTQLMGKVSVRSTFFHVTSVVEDENIKRVIEAVLEMKKEPVVLYWKEY